MRRGQSGMSLLELMTAMAVFTVVAGGAYTFFHRAELSAGIREASAQAEQDARNLVDRMVIELRQAGLTCPDWSFAPTSITFNKAIAFDGDNIVWSPAITYDLAPALGETTNGVDDNGNNLVDECYLRRTEDQTAPPAWTGYELGQPLQTFGGLVEANELLMTIDEDLITIQVTVATWNSLTQSIVAGRQVTSVAMRN